jgi:hypothetical protein
MARHTSNNYTTDGGFGYADANGDQFLHGDVQGVGKSFEFHDHTVGRGVGVGSVAAGTDASRPVAGHAGAIYWAYDTGKLYLDSGSSWSAAIMDGASQTLTNKTLTSPVLNNASLTAPSTDKLTITGPAAIASLMEAGIVSASGAPASGTWQQYTVGYDEAGAGWFCTAGGTPGTWVRLGPALPVTVPNGGTGLATLTSHGVLTGAGTGNVAPTAEGATNTVLHGNTGAIPTFSAIVGGDLVAGTLTSTQMASAYTNGLLQLQTAGDAGKKFQRATGSVTCSTSGAIAGMYQGNVTINWPASFATTPYVGASVSSGGTMWIGRISAVSAASITVYAYTDSSGTAGTIEVWGIG